MAIPLDLVVKCDRNSAVWKRRSIAHVEAAFDNLKFNKESEIFEFYSQYCMQFLSDKIDYELLDFIDEDGKISSIVSYFREELGLPESQIPISSFEAESIYAVDSVTNEVIFYSGEFDRDLSPRIISNSFYRYMIDILP